MLQNGRGSTCRPTNEPEGTEMSGQSNVIVVGVDGSASGDLALRWAAAEADGRKAGLHAVHAYSVPPGYAGPGGLIPPSPFEEARRWAEDSLELARALVHEQYPAVPMVLTAALHTPFAALQQAAEHALMAVVGSHGQGVVSETLLGSVAMKMVGHARTPVVVVRTDPHDRPQLPTAATAPVLVGIDGSRQGDAALAFAFEEASVRGVPLVALHSWDDQPLHGFQRTYPLPLDADAVDADERRVLAEEMAGWSDKYPDVTVELQVVRGRAAANLLRVSESLRPCLMVVGSRGRGGFAGLLLGSTSHAVTAYGSGPVAVVQQR